MFRLVVRFPRASPAFPDVEGACQITAPPKLSALLLDVIICHVLLPELAVFACAHRPSSSPTLSRVSYYYRIFHSAISAAAEGNDASSTRLSCVRLARFLIGPRHELASRCPSSLSFLLFRSRSWQFIIFTPRRFTYACSARMLFLWKRMFFLCKSKIHLK